MDKELQQLLDEARANGATVEQLDNIYNTYVKKKEDPEPSVVSESPSLSAGENFVNNAINVGLQIQGIPSRFASTIVSTAKNTLGREIGEFVTDAIYSSNPITSGMAALENSQDFLLAQTAEELKKIDEDFKPVNSVAEIESYNSVAKAASTVSGGVMQLIPTALASGMTGGIGIYTDMMGYALQDYNSEIAKQKGKSLEQLYLDDEDEFFVPATIGAAAGVLEKAGWKGIGKAINQQLAKTGTKEIAKAMTEAGFKEGFTEILQSSMEEANRAIANGAEGIEIAKKQVEFIFSKPGFESFLLGVYGGGIVTGAGKMLNRHSNIGSVENIEAKSEIKKDIFEVDQLSRDKELDDQERAEYKAIRDKKVEQYKEVQKKETEFYDKFSDEDYNEVKDLDAEIGSVLTKIDRFKSEDGKKVLEKEADKLLEKKKAVEKKYVSDDSEAFVETGEVSAEVVEEVATKIKQGEELAPQEQDVYQEKSQEVESKLKEFAEKEKVAGETGQAIAAGAEKIVQPLRQAIATTKQFRDQMAEQGEDTTEADQRIKVLEEKLAEVQEPQPTLEKPSEELPAQPVVKPTKTFDLAAADSVTETSPEPTKSKANKKLTDEFKKSLDNATSLTEFIGNYGKQGDGFSIDRANYVVQSVTEEGNKKRVAFSLIDSKGNKKRNYTATIENGKPVTIRNAKGLIDVFKKKKKASYNRFKEVAKKEMVEVETKKETKTKKEQKIFTPKSKKGLRYAMSKAFGLKDSQSEAATEIIYRGMKTLAARKGIPMADVAKGIRYVKGTESDAVRLLKQSKHSAIDSDKIHDESMTLAQLNPIEHKIVEKYTKEGIDDPIVVEGINILNRITGKNILRRKEGVSFSRAVNEVLETDEFFKVLAQNKIISTDFEDLSKNKSLDSLVRLEAASGLNINLEKGKPLADQVSDLQVEEHYRDSIENARLIVADHIKSDQQTTIDAWSNFIKNLPDPKEKLRALTLFEKLISFRYDLNTNKDYKRDKKSTANFTPMVQKVALQWVISEKSEEHPLKSYIKMLGESKQEVLNQSERVVYNKDGFKVYKFSGISEDTFGVAAAQEIDDLVIMTQDTIFCTKYNAKQHLNRGDFYLLTKDGKVVTAINIDNQTRAINQIKGETPTQSRIAKYKDVEHDFILNSGEIENAQKFVDRENASAEAVFNMPQYIETKEDAEKTIRDFVSNGAIEDGDGFIREFEQKGGWDLLGVTPEQVMLVSWANDNYDHNKYLQEIGNIDQEYNEDNDEVTYYPTSDIKVIINLDTDGPPPSIVYRDTDVNIEKIYIREGEDINIELPLSEKYNVKIGDVEEVLNTELIDGEDRDLSNTSLVNIIPSGTIEDWNNLVSTTSIKVEGRIESTLHIKSLNGIWDLEVGENGFIARTRTTKSYQAKTPEIIKYDLLKRSQPLIHNQVGPGTKLEFTDYWKTVFTNATFPLFQVSELSKEIKSFKSKDKSAADKKAKELRDRYKLMNLKVYKYKGEYKIKAIRDKKQKYNIKGAMAIEDGAFMIYALTNPDVTTPLHEFAHVYERYLTDDEIKVVEKWSGFKDGTVDMSEAFARGFERYLHDGKAPVPALQKIFDNLRKWLKQIYSAIRFKSIERELTPEVRNIFDNMLMTDAEKAQIAENESVQQRLEAVQAEEAAEIAKKTKATTKTKPTPKKKAAPKKETGDPLKLPNGRLSLGGESYIEYKGLEEGEHKYKYYDEMMEASTVVNEESAKAFVEIGDSGPLFQSDMDFESMPDLADEMYNESEKELAQAEKDRKGKFGERFKNQWSDRQGNIRKKLIDSGFEISESLMTNKAGSKARGVNRFHKYENEIYDGLTREQEKLTNKILQFERIVQIEQNRRARRNAAQSSLESIKEKRKAVKEGLNLSLKSNETKEIKSVLKKIDDKISQLKKRIEDNGVMKHPQGVTEDYAKWWLENKAPRYSYYSTSKEAANKYFSATNDLLKYAYDKELIDEQTYNRFVEDKYITRSFIDKIFEIETDANGEIVAVNYKAGDMYKESGLSTDQIKQLRSGSEGALIMDSRFLLEKMTVSLSNRAATNEMNNALANELKGKDAIPWYREGNYDTDKEGNIKTNQFGDYLIKPASGGFENVFYREGGKKRAFQLNKELHSEWTDSLRSINQHSQLEDAINLASGATVLKAAATGYNPMFFLSNVPMDVAHVLFFTDIYDDNLLLPVSFYKVTRNISKYTAGLVEADAGLKTSRAQEASKLLDEYIENGGMMEFFTTYGQEGIKGLAERSGIESKINSKTKKILRAAGQKIAYTGEKTELAMRLSSYSQVKTKLTKERAAGKNSFTDAEIAAIAVSKARKTMDFNQGGVTAKKLDRWVPYLNAGVQGFRISREYLMSKGGAAKFGTKLAQVSVFVGGLMMYNLTAGDDEEEYDQIPDYEKDAYFIFLLPFKDEEGNRRYFRLRKSPQLAPFINAAEMVARSVYYNSMGKKDPMLTEEKISRVYESMKDALPVGLSIRDILNRMPPSISGANKYITNYDSYRRSVISPDTEFGKILPKDEGLYDKSIPYFFKAIGQVTGASPRRLKAATETIVTSPSTNGLVAVGYSIGDFVANMLYKPSEKQESMYNGSVMEALTGIKESAQRRVIRSIRPNWKDTSMDKAADIEMTEGSVRYRIKKITDQFAKEKDKEEFKEFLKTVDNPADVKYAIDRYMKISTTDLSQVKKASYILDVMYARDPEAQAKIFAHYFGKPDFTSKETLRPTIEQLKYMEKTLGFKPSRRFMAQLKTYK